LSEKQKGYAAVGRQKDINASLREIAAELAELGFLNERGVMFSAASVASILA
jgi:hypothetical protein